MLPLDTVSYTVWFLETTTENSLTVELGVMDTILVDFYLSEKSTLIRDHLYLGNKFTVSCKIMEII